MNMCVRFFFTRLGLLNNITSIVIVCLLLLFAPRANGQSGSSTILLRDSLSRQPLTGATIVSLNSRFKVFSDSAGQVVIPLFIYNKGEKLQVSMVGYKPLVIQAGSLKRSQEMAMQQDVRMLEEVVVTSGSPVTKVREIQMGTEQITAAEAKRLPAIIGEVDIIKVLQLKPGVKSAGEGLAGFYVRGGGADQNLILIDNAPVYNPNHLLGLFSIFNNDALREVKLYKAAYPAVYSGRLSSVLDVSFRSGSADSFAVTGGIGFLSSRLSVDVPLKKGVSSLAISGRRTYFDIFTKALNRAKKEDPEFDPIPSYFFSDLTLRGDWLLNNNNAVWLTGYLGADNFKSPEEESAAKFTWGNRTASLNWRSLVPGKTEITSTLFYSGYQYRLGYNFDLNDLSLRSGIRSAGLKLVARSVSENNFRWQAGLDGMMHSFNIGDFSATTDLSGFKAGEKLSGNEGGVFINSEWDKSRNLSLLGGLRLSGFYAAKKLYLNPEPRLGARINVSENAAIKVSLTRMYQYMHQASLSSASLPTDIWYPSTGKTRPQFADQVSIGWAQSLKNNTYFFSMEGYYKRMFNQVEFRDGANVFGNPRLENDFVFGRANAYGLEAFIEKKRGRTTGWIGYTLSWANRRFADINDGNTFRPRYDRRHDVSVVFIHKLNHKLTLSGNWIFGSGAYITVPVGRYIYQDQIGDRVYTITPIYNKRSNYQLPPVHRLDISLVIALKSKRGSQDLTVSLYNAYSRRNPFYIQFRERDNIQGFVTAIEPTLVSLFPVLPGVTYNFKF
jgi:hypothetical protein